MLNDNTARDVALTSLMAGGASGAVVCLGSAPFELVKVGVPNTCQAFELMRAGATTTRIPNLP